jgi:c-di-GMP-binding flagellar brake protein YcgR
LRRHPSEYRAVIFKKQAPTVTRPRGIQNRGTVTLRIAGMRSVEARVEEVGDTYAILGMFREPEQPLAHLGAVAGTVDTVGKRGRIRVAATVHQHNDELDAVRVEFGENPKTVRRREVFRMETMAAVVVSRESGAQAETHTLDISESGLLLAGPEDLETGERVWVAIDVGEDPAVRARARVVRITDENHKAVQFDEIDQASRDRFVRFLFARQRLAARVKRQ